MQRQKQRAPRRRVPGLRLRGSVWHIQKQIAGVGPLNESTGETDYAQAERYLEKRVTELRRVMVYGERPRTTLRDAAEKYLAEYRHLKAIARAQFAIDRLLPSMGDMDISQIHDGAVSAYSRSRLAAGAAANTVNREIGVLRRILMLAARVWRHPNGLPYLDTAPLLRLAEGRQRAAYPLTLEEQGRLFRLLPRHLADAALFAVHTGLRDGELTGLRWSWQVALPGGGLAFILPAAGTKTGKDRVVFLNRVAARIVEAQHGKHPDYVFTYDGRPMSRLLNTAWKKARMAAGLPQVRIHDLRHTFATRLRAIGVSLEDRQDLLGHTSARGVTTHYSAADLGRLQQVVERLADDSQIRGQVLRIARADSRQPAEGGTVPRAVSA